MDCKGRGLVLLLSALRISTKEKHKPRDSGLLNPSTLVELDGQQSATSHVDSTLSAIVCTQVRQSAWDTKLTNDGQD